MNKTLSETVHAILNELNSEKITDEVIGFWLEDGENANEVFANVVFLMEPLNNSNDYAATEVDDACTIVAEKLSGSVTHTHCWFRTKEEFESDFSDVVALQQAS